MVCGLGLGILLICLVQAEHICCSWAAKALSSKYSSDYAGFSQQDGRLRRVDGSYPQNQVRQVFVSPRSVQRSSPNTETAVHSGSGRGLPASSYTPARSPVRLQSRLVSKPSWEPTSSARVGAQAVPPQSFGLSTAIASGSSVSGNQKVGVGKKGPWSAQQGPQRASKHPSSAGRAGSASTLFSPVGPAPHGSPARMQTYARAPARKVLSSRKPGALKSSISPRSGNSYTGQQSAGTGAKTQGSYRPAQTLGNRPSSRIPVQGTRNLAVSISSTAGASAPGFAPVSVYKIPQRFGGSPIRRLRDPAEQEEVRTQKPQRTPPAPPQQAAYHKPQLPSAHPGSKWNRVNLQRRL